MTRITSINMRNGGKRWTKLEDQELEKMVANRTPSRQIAEQLCRTASAIDNRIAKLKTTKAHHTRKLTIEDIKGIHELNTDGVSAAEIAKQYNIGVATVYRHLPHKPKKGRQRMSETLSTKTFNKQRCIVINLADISAEQYINLTTSNIKHSLVG